MLSLWLRDGDLADAVFHADFLLRRIQALMLCPNLALGKEAKDFLLNDDWQFQVFCNLAGIDAEKLRRHLHCFYRIEHYRIRVL